MVGEGNTMKGLRLPTSKSRNVDYFVLTRMSRPSICVPVNLRMASSASSAFSMVMNANPLGRPWSSNGRRFV